MYIAPLVTKIVLACATRFRDGVESGFPPDHPVPPGRAAYSAIGAARHESGIPNESTN